MKTTLLIISIFISINLFSQEFKGNLIELDSSIGKIISINEIKHYQLFRFIDSTNYEYSNLYLLNDSTFRLEVHFINSLVHDTILNKSAIMQAKENIMYMNKYNKPIERKNELITLFPPKINGTKDISNPNKLSNNIIINAELYVQSKSSNKKMKLKEGKFYYFKRKNNDKFNYLEIKEKYRGYTYAKINKILFNTQLNETTIIIKRYQGTFHELIEVKLDNILNIKQNTFDSALVKSMGMPKGYGFWNPLSIFYTPPLLLYKLLFNMKRFDLTDNSYFKIIQK